MLAADVTDPTPDTSRALRATGDGTARRMLRGWRAVSRTERNLPMNRRCTSAACTWDHPRALRGTDCRVQHGWVGGAGGEHTPWEADQERGAAKRANLYLDTAAEQLDVPTA